MKTSVLSLTFVLGLAGSTLFAVDSPQWRGPRRDGHSPDKSTMAKWPDGGPKRLWSFDEAGLGYSGFSVVANRLYTLGARDDIEHIICVDAATGKELWAAPLGAIYKNGWGDGPRGTPTVDGDRVYALSGRGNLACVSAKDGKEMWKTDLVKDLGGSVPNWGFTESVLIDGNNVICTPGGSKTMAAIDKMTGKTVWQSDAVEGNVHYSSPIRIEFNGQPQLVQRTERSVFGVSAADGKVLWRTGYPGRTAVIPTPVYSDGIVYVTAGYGAGCKAVKLGKEDPELVYENTDVSNHHGGVILVGDKIYGHHDQRGDGGGWVCQDFKSGKVVWKANGIGKGACTFVAGKLICLGESDGTVALVEASPDGWKEISRFKLEPQTTKRSPRGKIWTHPVVVDGRLFLRDQELIHCYDVRG